MNIYETQRSSVASTAVWDALEHAAILWHAEHPDDPQGMDYTTSGNEFLRVAERVYCMTQTERRPEGPQLFPPDRERASVVYVAYGDDDCTDVLYIGVTSNFNRRMYSHRKKSGWWPYAAMVRCTEYPSRFLANRAELESIQRWKPPWNRVWAR